jgi:hypothetical protein
VGAHTGHGGVCTGACVCACVDPLTQARWWIRSSGARAPRSRVAAVCTRPVRVPSAWASRVLGCPTLRPARRLRARAGACVNGRLDLALRLCSRVCSTAGQRGGCVCADAGRVREARGREHVCADARTERVVRGRPEGARRGDAAAGGAARRRDADEGGRRRAAGQSHDGARGAGWSRAPAPDREGGRSGARAGCVWRPMGGPATRPRGARHARARRRRLRARHAPSLVRLCAPPSCAPQTRRRGTRSALRAPRSQSAARLPLIRS